MDPNKIVEVKRAFIQLKLFVDNGFPRSGDANVSNGLRVIREALQGTLIEAQYHIKKEKFADALEPIQRGSILRMEAEHLHTVGTPTNISQIARNFIVIYAPDTFTIGQVNAAVARALQAEADRKSVADLERTFAKDHHYAVQNGALSYEHCFDGRLWLCNWCKSHEVHKNDNGLVAVLSDHYDTCELKPPLEIYIADEEADAAMDQLDGGSRGRAAIVAASGDQQPGTSNATTTTTSFGGGGSGSCLGTAPPAPGDGGCTGNSGSGRGGATSAETSSSASASSQLPAKGASSKKQRSNKKQ